MLKTGYASGHTKIWRKSNTNPDSCTCVIYVLIISFLQESIVNDKIQSVLSRVEEFKHQLDHVSSE